MAIVIPMNSKRWQQLYLGTQKDAKVIPRKTKKWQDLYLGTKEDDKSYAQEHKKMAKVIPRNTKIWQKLYLGTQNKLDNTNLYPMKVEIDFEIESTLFLIQLFY